MHAFNCLYCSFHWEYQTVWTWNWTPVSIQHLSSWTLYLDVTFLYQNFDQRYDFVMTKANDWIFKHLLGDFDTDRLVSITQTLFPVFQRTSEPKEKATRNFGKQLNCAKRNNNSTDNLSKLLILSFFIFSKKWFKRFLKNRMYLVFFALCVLEYPQAFLEGIFFFSFSYYGLGDRDFIDKLGIRSLVWQFYSPTAR